LNRAKSVPIQIFFTLDNAAVPNPPHRKCRECSTTTLFLLQLKSVPLVSRRTSSLFHFWDSSPFLAGKFNVVPGLFAFPQVGTIFASFWWKGKE
jgi:hypothetical protein